MTYLLLWLAFGALGALMITVVGVADDRDSHPDATYVIDSATIVLWAGFSVLGPITICWFCLCGWGYLERERE
jgi:hypothetical protein